MIVQTLIGKIASLFICIAIGFLLVRIRVLKTEDSLVLSRLSLYLVTPCMLLHSFQVDFTPEVRGGLLLATLAAFIVESVYLLLSALLRKPLRLDRVEQVSIEFSNAGNLIIPIVTAVLGPEWVVYASPYIAVQNIFLWSVGKATLCGERGIDFRRMLTNVNLLAVFAGLILCVTGLRFPAPLDDALSSIGSMMGPLAMLVIGMLIGGMDLRLFLSYRRSWLVAALRLLVLPAAALLILKFTPLYTLAANGRQLLLITLLAACAPTAVNITNMSQVFGQDARYASAVNITNTLLSALTIPLIVLLYEL
ncbi:MAG: AEC family transporter [Oscillospiraceae bacterium]|nr:AEC family transporter [Oscillospiraceae bacterium]